MLTRLLLLLSATLLIASSLTAQIDPGPCDTCWLNDTYDSSLVIGGHQIENVSLANVLYRMTLNQAYAPGEGLDGMVADIASNDSLKWTLSASHPWGGYWEAPLLDSSVSLATRVSTISKNLRGRNYRTMIETGVKLSVIPPIVASIYANCALRENFYSLPDDFSQYPFTDTDLASSAGPETIRTTFDTLRGSFYWYGSTPASTESEPTLLAANPQRVMAAFGVTGADLYQNAGLTDLTRWISMGVAIKPDVDELRLLTYGNDTVIAYIDLYVRNPYLQDTCQCRIFEPWKRIDITKQDFFNRYDASNHLGKPQFQSHVDDYTDVDTLIDFDLFLHSQTSAEASTDSTGYSIWDFTKSAIPSGAATVQYGDSTYVTAEYCDSILQWRLGLASSDTLSLLAGSKIIAPVTESNFFFEVYSMNLVDIDLYRTRVAAPHYVNLREGKYDSLIADAVDYIYADSLLNLLVGRIGVGDEPDPIKYPAYNILTQRVQVAIDANPKGKLDPKPIWSNPQFDFDALRLAGGDFDSTRFRQVQTPARQTYKFNGDDLLPIFYGNPDSLGVRAWDTVFDGATEDRACVAINVESDYDAYTSIIQNDIFARYNDQFGVVKGGGTVSGTARLVDVMRFKFRDRFPNVPSSAVWNVVQTFGSMGRDENGYTTYTRSRPPTREEIIGQAWLSMASGANGLIFGDLVYNSFSHGIQTIHIRDAELYDDLEYGVYRSTNQSEQPDTDPKWRIDSMWLGFDSRNEGVTETVNDLVHIDTTIGWKNLIYNREQMTVYDTLQSFDEVPMVGDLRLERAKRHDVTYNSTTELWTFEASDTFDVQTETYAELTHYSIATEPNSRAMMIVNRRTWPIDTLTYGDRADSLCAIIDTTESYSLTGLGAIDVRRPVVVLENSTSIIGDSVIVEKITPNGTWTTIAAFGDTVELDWLLPGRGALYKLTPTAGGLSEHATAYNNAVHSENPSTDSTSLDRLVVYERDSVVYLRSVDPNGVWSAELMLSDPDDTVLVAGKRTASNFFPALAVARDGTGSARFVWERDSAGYRSVETAYINGVSPVSRAMIDSTIAGEYAVEQHRLITPDSLVGPPALTPSIVAATDDELQPGFLVSWANHDEGIDLMAVRHLPVNATSLSANDTAGLYGLHATEYALKVGQYPTLATAMIQERLPIPPTDFVSGPMPEPADTIGTIERADLTLAHLAWQQGDGVDGADELIYYRRVGTDFSKDEEQPTLAAVDTVEHVSKNIPGCSFEHPSIAADSVQVGVAFEAFGNIGTSRVVTLRHRDTVGNDPLTGAPLKAWETTYYRFGNVFGASPFNVGYADGENVRPSLTHFPELDSTTLQVQPEGGLAWFWEDNDEGRGHPQYMYRYGWFTRRSLDDGGHPSLTLVPLAETNPFEQSSVLHRGDSAERVVGTNDEATSVWYYSGHLLNTPGNPLPALFNDPPSTGGVIAGISVFVKDPSFEAFCQPIHRGFEWGIGFDHPTTDHPDDDRHPPGDPGVVTSNPGLPPTFFDPAVGGTTILDEIEGSERISRTGVFAAGDESVDVIRYAAARDSVAIWLDTQPFDTERGVAANIWSVVELVRASDSVVLWRGDTLTARGLDTTTSPVTKVLSVPVEQWADSGEVVWIQVRGFATSGVDLSTSGGFTFFESFETTPSAKRGIGRGAKESGSSYSTLDLAVIPNPVTSDRAVLNVGNRGEGWITVTLWDNRGHLLRELPGIDAMRAGVYSVELDLRGLVSGGRCCITNRRNWPKNSVDAAAFVVFDYHEEDYREALPHPQLAEI